MPRFAFQKFHDVTCVPASWAEHIETQLRGNDLVFELKSLNYITELLNNNIYCY